MTKQEMMEHHATYLMCILKADTYAEYLRLVAKSTPASIQPLPIITEARWNELALIRIITS